MDRRTLLKAIAATPLVPAATWAAGGRVALVIGNNAYAGSPLVNPGNDARAMDGLLRQAGFEVDLLTDAGLQTMAAAVERFGAAVRRPGIGTAVFYYAGHGAQVDWKNYLLPVDASVRNATELKSRCIELNRLLQHFAQAHDRTFVIILDACRDNPFGAGYRPEQKGLSQFDAPVGTLLAYATAPGSVARDGDGQNGLYTSHLLRELAVRTSRLEDCLKRVRLNVRLASNGAQVPWESTSLEDDLYLFSDQRPKLGEEEIERQFAEELADWNRTKASQRSDDWVAYLRRYPTGRFSEAAQARLARLLAAVEARPSLPPVPTAVQIEAGVHTGSQFQPSANPYSAGSYPLARRFRVGDKAVYRRSDMLTGVEEGLHTAKVTRVDADNDMVEINGGKAAWDLLGNPIRSPQRSYDGPLQFFPAELQLGKKWVARMMMTTASGRRADIDLDVKVAALEKVTVPAGEFYAFRIEAKGWNNTAAKRIERRFWVVPGLNFYLKAERNAWNTRGAPVETERDELVSLRQAG